MSNGSQRDGDASAHRYSTIRGFERDVAEGEWIALLDCGHRQHVRHKPPWMNRAWVRTEQGRAGAIGRSLRCRLCEQGL